MTPPIYVQPTYSFPLHLVVPRYSSFSEPQNFFAPSSSNPSSSFILSTHLLKNPSVSFLVLPVRERANLVSDFLVHPLGKLSHPIASARFHSLNFIFDFLQVLYRFHSSTLDIFFLFEYLSKILFYIFFCTDHVNNFFKIT